MYDNQTYHIILSSTQDKWVDNMRIIDIAMLLCYILDAFFVLTMFNLFLVNLWQSMFFHKKLPMPFIYNDRKISFQEMKIWIYVSEETNSAFKDQYFMEILKLCVNNIHYASIPLIMKKGVIGDIHLTMRSWLDRDQNTIYEYSFNAREVLLSILNNEQVPELVRNQALSFYSEISTKNIVSLAQRSSNVIPLRI